LGQSAKISLAVFLRRPKRRSGNLPGLHGQMSGQKKIRPELTGRIDSIIIFRYEEQ